MVQIYSEYLKKARARSKRYYDKKKNDPEFKKRRLKQWHAWKKRKKQPQS